ncbi:ribose-phosphate diphosphokinase [Curvibacter sp. APW13]|uniref:ribose-phosphate diphosphokinase n=1 Tax=Curvibacter sp. APW13 TaxID=3077236 RepID=UPI0028DE33D9|nr:ribose-phosphate diphosphokinase [Curvibacter sp. APW13]MDT8992146.1 ribose-phosphate diphosphokinase [Curvibacter sp. APW13]
MSLPSPLLLHFEEDQPAAEQLARACGMVTAAIARHRFPDGELKLRLPPQLPARVVLLRSLHHPNEKLTELLLVAPAARTLGAQHLTLVTPYLAYMRQDMAFNPGEVVSQRIVGRFLAGLFDAVLTVDPHLHRVATLEEAVPVPQAVVLSGAPLLARLIAERLENPLLIGPDEESAQWIAQAAQGHGFDFGVCRKVRHGDRDVQIELPTVNVHGRSVVVLDDVASSGRTLAGAARLLLAAGAATVDVAVTHALFAGDALQVIQDAGVRQVWSTDTITHPSNAVSMAESIAQALQALHA